MAIDEALLNAALSGLATLRFYEWEVPTVSLGHFQSVDSIPPDLRSLPVVKRLSGGGAILHDQELTYSCVLPKGHPVTQEPGTLYDLIHQVIIQVLGEFSVSCEMRGDRSFEDASFLCFARGDARDLVIGDHKIVGSAQRRRQGAVLQHGSILLRTSTHAQEFPGIEELTGIALRADALIPRLADRIADLLAVEIVPGCITPEEEAGLCISEQAIHTGNCGPSA